MQIIDCIIENIVDVEDNDTNRQALLDSNILNKTSEEIAAYLTGIPPGEVGGLTAISGFYYQFLVTIEYIIEMLEGKWDYVLMEHHDDIVVGKEKKIRFIQVKTSGKVKIDGTASPASGLYLRDSKIIDGTSFKKNNSWVDKLISNAELTPRSKGFQTEFQLYTSYQLMRTTQNDFDIYTDNEGYDKAIPPEDHLLIKMSKPVCNKDGDTYNYHEKCGETISELLSRLYIRTGISLSQVETLKNDLCMKLNKWVFKEIGENFTMKVEDLHMLIGYLCTKCTYKNKPEILLIDSESVKEILEEIRKKSLNAASMDLNKHDSTIVANKVLEELLGSVEQSNFKDFLQDKLYTYREYIKYWISKGGDIKELIERYVEGTNRTKIYSNLSENNRETRLQEFFSVVLILIIGRDSFLQFTDSKGLLSKQCTKTNQVFSFLSLEQPRNLQFGKNKLESIIRDGSLEDQLFLIDKDLHIILQNYTDRTFIQSTKWERVGESIEGGQEFADDPKLNKVPLTAFIIPGKELHEDFLSALYEEKDISESLTRIWESYEGNKK